MPDRLSFLRGSYSLLAEACEVSVAPEEVRHRIEGDRSRKQPRTSAHEQERLLDRPCFRRPHRCVQGQIAATAVRRGGRPAAFLGESPTGTVSVPRNLAN
jgi:hypothetical protein